MSKYIQALFIIILFNNINCLFDKVKYMNSSLDAIGTYNTIVKSKKVSLVLIYSDGCPHCRKFEPDYIKLSEDYHSVVNFYLLPTKSNYKEKFRIRGVPTVFFFNGKKFIEHKGLNKYDIISYLLESDYLKKCKEINYNFLLNQNDNYSLFNENEKTEKNIIIGYFPNDNDYYNEDDNNTHFNKLIRKKAFDNFINKTQKIISLLDNCYYIRDLNNDENEINNILNEGTVIAISKTKGINIFKGYNDIYKDNEENNENYYNDRIKDIGERYSKFLNDKIKDFYIEITESKMASKLKAYIKRNVIFFVYKNIKEKNEYINQISSLIAITKNDKYPLFDYVLFKYGCDLYQISGYFDSNGIYYADKKLSKFSKQIDLNIIIEMINTQNNYEYNEKNLEELMKTINNTNISNNTNIDNNNIDNKNQSNNKYDKKNERIKEKLYYEKIKERIIEHQLKTYLNNIPKKKMFDSKKIKSIIFFIICLIGYSFGFDYFYKRYYPGKSIFNIFSECFNCLNSICCFDEDEEDFEIEQRKIQIKNKKIDDINDENPKIVKTQN